MRKQLSAGVIALVAAGLIAVGAAAAGATNDNAVQNGGFETGKFKPWKTDGGPGNGFWLVYDDGGPFFPPPAEGDLAAGAFQFIGPTGMTLTQKFRLRQKGPSILFFLLAYAEFGGGGAPQHKAFGSKTPTPRCAPDDICGRSFVLKTTTTTTATNPPPPWQLLAGIRFAVLDISVTNAALGGDVRIEGTRWDRDRPRRGRHGIGHRWSVSRARASRTSTGVGGATCS